MSSSHAGASGARAREGELLPELVVTPSAMQIFQFSAATWNRHHVHYSKDAAVAEGLPDVVVQRALLGNFLARMLAAWTGDPGAIRELSWKVVRSATPGTVLTCRGTVRTVERVVEHGSAGDVARCDLEIVNAAGETVAAGAATVLLEGADDAR